VTPSSAALFGAGTTMLKEDLMLVTKRKKYKEEI
jgi:hypothetical protein